MGRHRRSAAGRAATGRATGVTHHDGPLDGGPDPLNGPDGPDGPPTMGIAPYLNPEAYEAYAQTYARSEAYLFATDSAADEAVGHTAEYAVARGATGHAVAGDGFQDGGGAPGERASGHRRRKRKAAPVRTGLLGVSAAVALGTVAVATGAVPGLENYKLGGDSSTGDTVQAEEGANNLPSGLGGASDSPEARDRGTATGEDGRDGKRSASPKPSASASESAKPTKTSEKTPEKKTSTAPAREKAQEAPTRKAAPTPEKQTSAPVTVSAEAAAGAEVLRLVNTERAKVGCSPVAANSALTDLATAFSDDMAARGFFDHTDPDGDTPWDRAEAAGISNLGGENIARGQADVEAVMEAWMNSPGHKANILNCDFTTLGVGVHMGPGGPWWTQNFGY
ncbi:CAP domain-containing protein [Streptomyces calvus]|uniref:CAP domain-containing protein n=1 Tax=Streptomyces calvus TaxID=67282 RepID=UPI0037132BB3